jgi:hypothetical protein
LEIATVDAPKFEPVILKGLAVRLEPMARAHEPLLWDVVKDHLEEIFRWIQYSMRTREDFHSLIDKTFAEQQRGESLAFATVERDSGLAIGSTRFHEYGPRQSVG